MSTSWYYADRQQQQQGPVDADGLRAAHARGEISDATLVWREGLPAWQPLAQVAAEVGIVARGPAAVAPPPFAAPPAARRPVVVAKSSGTPWLLILLIIGGVVVVFGGILAAIAIPAYHDYTVRAKVGSALSAASPAKLAVEEFMLSDERCPSNGEAGIGTPESYADGMLLKTLHAGALEDGTGRCGIELQLEGSELGFEPQTLTLIRRDTSDWVYSTTLEPRVLPPSVRQRLED